MLGLLAVWGLVARILVARQKRTGLGVRLSTVGPSDLPRHDHLNTSFRETFSRRAADHQRAILCDVHWGGLINSGWWVMVGGWWVVSGGWWLVVVVGSVWRVVVGSG